MAEHSERKPETSDAGNRPANRGHGCGQPQGSDHHLGQETQGTDEPHGGAQSRGTAPQGQMDSHHQQVGQPGQPAGDGESGDDEMDRRQLMIYGGGAVVGLGAIYFLLGSSSPDGPEGVIYDMVDAFESGDEAAIQGLIHEDSPLSYATLGFGPAAGTFDIFEGVDMSTSVEGTEVLEREDAPGFDTVQEFAIVEATTVTEFTFQGQTEENRETDTGIVALNNDGEWKYWSDGDRIPS